MTACTKCEVPLNETDLEAGYCTQCKEPVKSNISPVTFKVLILDQFSGVTPYWLDEHRQSFDELCTMTVRSDFYNGLGRKPLVKEVDATFRTSYGTTCLRAAVDGTAEVWQYRWDSN